MTSTAGTPCRTQTTEPGGRGTRIHRTGDQRESRSQALLPLARFHQYRRCTVPSHRASPRIEYGLEWHGSLNRRRPDKLVPMSAAATTPCPLVPDRQCCYQPAATPCPDPGRLPLSCGFSSANRRLRFRSPGASVERRGVIQETGTRNASRQKELSRTSDFHLAHCKLPGLDNPH